MTSYLKNIFKNIDWVLLVLHASHFSGRFATMKSFVGASKFAEHQSVWSLFFFWQAASTGVSQKTPVDAACQKKNDERNQKPDTLALGEFTGADIVDFMVSKPAGQMRSAETSKTQSIFLKMFLRYEVTLI